MIPLDPLQSAPDDRRPTPGKLIDEEENAADLVNIGRRIAETETRDAVTEQYVDEAYAGNDTEEYLAEISRAEISRAEAAEDFAAEIGPEANALHKEIPSES